MPLKPRVGSRLKRIWVAPDQVDVTLIREAAAEHGFSVEEDDEAVKVSMIMGDFQLSPSEN